MTDANPRTLNACPICGLQQTVEGVPSGARVHCARCDHLLFQDMAGEAANPKAVFELLDDQPDTVQMSPPAEGLKLILTTKRAGIAEGAPVYYRRLQVAKVLQSKLNQDGFAVEIEVVIDPQHTALVNSNSVFWNASGVQMDLDLSNPKIDVESLQALLVGGIAFATPADGGPQAPANTEFRLYSETEGRKRTQPRASGLHVVLTASQLGSVAVGDSVYYREVEVGEVVATGFEDNSASVRIHAVIDNRYAPLIRENSVFWNASGLHVDFSLFKGASLNVESLKALLAGGVAFATPQTQPGARAADGSHFPLHEKPEDVWLTWQPAIPLGPRQAEPRLLKIETATSGFSVEDMAPTPYVATTASHVRRGPGASYGIIETLVKDTTVEVTGKAMGLNWYRISLADGGVG